MKFFLLLALLILSVHLQTVTIRNLGCKSYNADQVCVDCSTRYYLDSSAICQPVNSNCKTYNSTNGACTSCYPGFGLLETTCLPGIVTNSFDPNCNSFDGDICTKCSQGFFLNSEKSCTRVSPDCKTYNQFNGACTSCYPGFSEHNGKCIITPSEPTVANCNELDPLTGLCIKCSFGYYFDDFGQCIQIDPNCKAFDTNARICRDCYAGYELNQNSQCIKSKAAEVDPNCKTFQNDVCTECAKGAIFNSQRVCILVNPDCLTYDPNNGVCTSCYPGFEVSAFGGCIKSEALEIDPNCKTFRNDVCTECAKGAIFNPFGACVIVNPSCKTYNEETGACTSCFAGFEVTPSGGCAKSEAPEGDPNCKTFENGICTKCSKGAVFNAFGVCMTVDPSCKTHDEADGLCTSCYAGFQLSDFRTCVKSVAPEGDPNCKTFQNGICIECSKGSIMNLNGVCISVDPTCLTYDEMDGSCTSCYPGYQVKGRTCKLSEAAEVSDPNCREFLTPEVCAVCSNRYFPNGFGRCQEVNPLCRNYDPTTGYCLSCYPGFALDGTICIESQQQVSDPNCSEFFEGICTKCSKGYLFLDNGKCGLVSPDCKEFNSFSGECTDCYLGYALQNGKCINSTNDIAAIDPNCAAFENNVCVKCSKNYFFGAFGSCTAVDPLCNGYNPDTGACTGCYASFVLRGPHCIEDKNNELTDPNCAEFFEGICIRCATRTFINNEGKCQDVDPSCNTYNPLNGLCNSCYPGFELQTGKCVEAVSISSCNKFYPDGTCQVCGQGSYLSQGTCILIDPQCASFDVNSRSCLSCYDGYNILNGACQISKVEEEFQVLNCFAYDQQNQCIKCYNRYYLTNNSCQQVNVFCKTYDDFTGACNSCYTTFTLNNGRCIN